MTEERLNDSLKEWYSYGEAYLAKAGIQDAKTDAWILLSHTCSITRSHYYLHMHDEMPKEQAELFMERLNRRAAHEPVQYITKEAWCYGNAFYVDANVLIPRIDTEILIEEAAKRIRPGMRVLDLCTGSGCILISLLRQKTIQGVGSDVSEGALEVASKNAAHYAVSAQLIQSDLFASISGRFHIIVSNPPYIPSHIIGQLDSEVRDYEPRLALDGGEDGLSFYRRIVEEAQDYLEDDGWLCLEIGFDQGEAVFSMMHDAGYQDVEVVQDYAKLDRVVLGRKHSDGDV